MNPFQSLIDAPRTVWVAVKREPKPAKPEKKKRRRGIAHPNPWGLSWLQSEVVMRLGTLSTSDIGRELRISNKTVETCLARAKEKMDVSRRAAMVELWTKREGVQ